jgi:hypothetical protein
MCRFDSTDNLIAEPLTLDLGYVDKALQFNWAMYGAHCLTENTGLPGATRPGSS